VAKYTFYVSYPLTRIKQRSANGRALLRWDRFTHQLESFIRRIKLASPERRKKKHFAAHELHERMQILRSVGLSASKGTSCVGSAS
jgi:hypothetical protein